MEQGEEIKVKTLRERFENDESSKIRTKPAIPEKPKIIPPISPTTKISNPLIASINSAVENRLAPRVVFKDDKKNHRVSQPQTSLVKAKPILLDKNQKKEADLIKQALKDKKILPLSPVTPVLEQTPQPESNQRSSETPVKVSTPNKKTIFNKDEKEKTYHSECDGPATPILNHSDSSISTPAKAEATVNKPVVPKARVPRVRANPTISAPVSSPPAVSVSKPSALTDPEPVSQNGPQMKNSRPDIPIGHNSNAISPTADIFSFDLPEEDTSIPEIPDMTDMDIPPPIVPEDFSDGGTSAVDLSANVTPKSSFPGAFLSVASDSSSPTLSHTASPIPATETPDSDAVFVFSPLPASLTPSTKVESMAENKMSESHKATDKTENPLEAPLSSSPKTISVVSALARAEEMAPVKHIACDQRLLNLLEKAKRKSTTGSRVSSPEMLPVIDTDLPNNAPFIPSPTETAHAEPLSHMEVPDAPGTLPDIPSVDYEGKAEEAAKMEYNTQPIQAALSDQDHRKSSPVPKMVIVQKPVVPPPPPPRKPQTTISNGGLIPEKPPQSPSMDIQSTVLPDQPLEDNGIIIPAPADFTQDYSTPEDSELCDPSETVHSQADYGNPGPSVHKEAFSEHLNLEHQNPNMNPTDVGLPGTVTTENSESVPDSLSNPTLPSPSGKQTNYSNADVEDVTVGKKNKIPKKQRKGSPLNPYADPPLVAEEIPKKALFSKKNSGSDEKDLKPKEKQKQKDKEKEKKELKEKEKKEQKEKEKDKELKEKERKEQKEKEKDKELKEKEKKEQKEKEKDKELKEKDKEKKEQKDKKKEQKEKERDKKELKEKEREKKEQKEKEKKENEMKKKFKITGQEETLYQTKVTETTKGRKDDLAVKAGELISIIRTTDCPKGKWLARDNTNKYGYIPVENVELNIEEIMVLGNKAKAANMPSINGLIESDAPRTSIISSPHYSLNQESFEDDSEEWGDDEDTVFQPTHTTNLELNQRVASSDIGPETVPALPAHTDRSDHVHAGQEALQKLSTFFAQPKPQNNTPTKEPVPLNVNPEEPVNLRKQEMDVQILPPPDLYADIVVG